jgi:ATP-binding cassette subfamily B protein
MWNRQREAEAARERLAQIGDSGEAPKRIPPVDDRLADDRLAGDRLANNRSAGDRLADDPLATAAE